MKKTAIGTFLAAAFLVFMTGIAMAVGMSSTDAGGTIPAAKSDSKLNAEIMMLNYDAKLPQADAVIMKQLADNFSVKPDKITSLMHKNLQYGEAAAVLAFAEKMPGGITDANINKVMSLHQAKTGWSDVAKSLGVDMSDIATKLGSIEDDTHSGIKEALFESTALGAGAGGVDSMTEPGAATGGTGSYEGVPGSGTGGTEGTLPESNESGVSGAGTGGVDSGTTGSGTGGQTQNPGGWSGSPNSPQGGGY